MPIEVYAPNCLRSSGGSVFCASRSGRRPDLRLSQRRQVERHRQQGAFCRRPRQDCIFKMRDLRARRQRADQAEPGNSARVSKAASLPGQRQDDRHLPWLCRGPYRGPQARRAGREREVPRAASGARLQPAFIPQVRKASQYLILGGSRRRVHDLHDMARLGVDLFVVRAGHHVQRKRLA